MAERSAYIGLSEGVSKLALSEALIDEMVKRTIDKLYDGNIVVEGVFIKTFTLAFNGQEVAIGVFVIEEDGIDKCFVTTKEEYLVRQFPNKPAWPTKRG